MKKLVSSLFAVIVMLFGGIFLTACNGQTITASFSQTEITIQIGERLDPFTLIEEDLSDEQKDLVDFKTSKSSVVYIDSSKQLVAANYGTATLYAVSGETTLASCTVLVPKPPIALSEPTGLKYDETLGKITWNAVYYSLDADVFLVPDYVLELKKDDAEFVKHDIASKTEFLIEDIGAYTARVQAKAPSNAFTSSAFTTDYAFKIMAAPTDLAFDIQTQTLSWSHNGNPDTTTYKIKYTLAGQTQKELTAETNSVIIPEALGAGNHTFQIETVPTEADVFKNVSAPLVVEKLSTLSVTFNNGTISWAQQQNATGYKVVVYLDGAKVGEETVNETSSSLPKLLATQASNKYSVTVQALGNAENNVFDGAVSAEYQFEKLPKAIVVFNTLEKTFEVLNANLGKTTLVLSSAQGAERLGGEVSSVVWSVITNTPYELKAQILTLSPAEEIDGDAQTSFKVDGAGEDLEKIRNLATFSILYQEADGKAYVKYIDEREENGIFTITKNNNPLTLTATDGAYEVGEVATMFNQENLISFKIERTKAAANQTYFVGNSQEFTVQKLPAPSVLNYNNGALSTIIPENVEIAKIEYLINDIETSSLDLTQSEWNIKVRLIAKTTSQNNKYYSSSNSAIFQIKRLDKVSNLVIDYTQKAIVFDRVSNVENYKIALGAETLLQEENTYHFGDYIGPISVTSIAPVFETLTSTQIGYLDSFAESVEVVKVKDIDDLKLQKSEEGIISAIWTAPAQTYGKTLNYSVYLKYTGENEEENHDFVLVQGGLTQTTFTFAQDQFDKVGQYEIKVEITSPNADFLTTETQPAKNVYLTRFAAPTALEKDGETLTVKDYNAETMAKVKIEPEIDGVTGQTEEQSYTIKLQPGQTLKLKVSYQDTFVEASRQYNLGSLASEFTIYKLGNLTNLEYKEIKAGQFQFYVTPSEVDENGTVPSFVQYSYRGVSSQASLPSAKISNTRNISYANSSGYGFTFYAKASASLWTTINAGDTKYLSSDEELSVNVYKENAVHDVQIHATENGVVLSWKFNTIDAYILGEDGYTPEFNVVYRHQATMIEETPMYANGSKVTQSAFGTPRQDDDGFYEYMLLYEETKDNVTINRFKDAGQYIITITAETLGYTIGSEGISYIINKLDKITNISIKGNATAVLVNQRGEEIDLTGTKEVVATGNGISISGTTLDLANVVAGQETTLEVYKKAKTEITEQTFYLDSDKTTFKFVKLEKQDLRLDLDTNNLSWSSVVDLPQNSVQYVLQLSQNGDVVKEILIKGAAGTTINLNAFEGEILGSEETENQEENSGANEDESNQGAAEDNTTEKIRLFDFIQDGTYQLSIKIQVLPYVLSYVGGTGATSGYLSSDFGAKLDVEKLADVTGFKGEYTENAGVIKFSWNAVTNASGYKLYFSDSLNQTKVVTTTETSLTYSEGFNLGTTNVSIEAVGSGKISSDRNTTIAVTVLNKVSSLQVSYNGVVSWNANLESQSLTTGGFVVEVYNSLGEKQCEVSVQSSLATSVNLFENQAAKTFIDSLNGQEFSVKVYVKGAINQTANAITISSATAEVTASKLFAPEIKIENNNVVVTSTNAESENLRYYVTIFNGAYNIFDGWFLDAIALTDNSSSFEIKAYATVVLAGVGAYNILDSNITTYSAEKLGVVSGITLKAAINDATKAQDNVILSWATVANATGYEIYVSVNGQESSTPLYTADKDDIDENGKFIFEFPAATFAASGTYGVKMRAISAQNLYSNFSEEVQVVRLAAMKGAYMSRDAILHFGETAQVSQDYQIFATVRNGLYDEDITKTILATLKDNALLNKASIETSDFQNYLNNNFESGFFYIHIRYVGYDVIINNVLTLASPETVINGYKLYAPTLTIYPDRIMVELDDNAISPSQTVHSVANTSLAVSKDGAVQKDDNGVDLLGFDGTELMYPNNWTGGVFEFNAITSPKTGVFNVLPSLTANVSATRLAAPDGLGFKRAVLSPSELQSYSSDVQGFTDYLSSKLMFVFDVVSNASGYILENQFEQYGSYLTTGINEITLGSALEDFFYKTDYSDEEENPDENIGENGEPVGPETGDDGMVDDEMGVEPVTHKEISLTAIAPAGGTYINSQKRSITYSILNPVEAFFATGEGFSWNTEDPSVVTFLIMAIYDERQKYWQAEDASQRESTLSNLHYEGDMSLNIKAIGNVSTAGTYDNIILDSKFLANNKAFTKLAQITDLGTDKGFFKFTKIKGAETYTAQVYGMTEEGVMNEDYLILQTDLIDYAPLINLADEDHFIGYSPSIAMLSPLDTYFIKIRAEASGSTILYADYSLPIQARVLSEVNGGGLTLMADPDNQINHLDRKIIEANIAQEASGLWIVEDGKFMAVPRTGTNTTIKFRPSVLQGGQKELQFASYGTSIYGVILDEENGSIIQNPQTEEHLLTSAFYTKYLTALEKPQIAITGGIISWPTVMGADGYYVYINDNMIVTDGRGMYISTSLALGDEYGGTENKPIKIEVVPVVVRDDGLWGPKATYNITQNLTTTKEKFENTNFVVKLHKPEGIKVYDGALLWSQGVTGLDNYNESALETLYTALTTPQGLTKQNLDAFDNAIEALFNSPITIYSKYSGFNQLVVQVTLKNNKGSYTFESDALTFVTLTESQRKNLRSLVNFIPSKLDALIKSLQENQASGELLYDYTREQNFENITQYAISRLSLILNNFSTTNLQLQQLLNAQNSVRFPSEDILFEELAGSVTSGLGYGNYQITISQRGNNADWLNSATSDAQKVYLPMAPQNLKIVQEIGDDNIGNGNYHLVWDKITLADGLTYSANLDGQLSSDIVYALYGDNASGNRKLLAKTIGTPFNEQAGQLSLSLTKLIEDGILDSNITSIYLVAMGNASGETDETRILSGLRSQVLSVTVLPEVLAKVVDGVLQIDPATDIENSSINTKFEVSSHDGSAFETQFVEGTNKFDASLFRSGTTYTVDVRFIGGPVSAGQDSFVLSGKKRTMRLEKLAPMDVSVNEYGNFVWARVNNSNGFVLSIGEEEGLYYERDSRVTTFEATTTGFKNYAFRTLGSTANVTNSIQTYYLNSDINNQGYGLNAVMLSAISRIFVENGLIKWTALDTSIIQNQTVLGDGELVIGYKLSFSNEVAVYTTQLDSSVFTKDNAGNFCFDFTNFGEEGTHVVQIQSYAQVQKSGIEVGTTTYGENLYTQLMGQKFESAFTKIAPPTNVQIYNGQLIWEGNELDTLYMYKITAQNQLITGETTEKQVWREEVLAGTQYEFAVRAYQEGMVFSSYSQYVDISTETNEIVKFTKIKFDTPVTSKTTEADGNYISFTLPDSAIELAINLKYKADYDENYSYLYFGDENYYDVISFTNKLVRINVTKLRAGIQSMEYYMQLVPLGQEPYLSSNFTDIDRYITPQALSVVYFDQTDKEFYFEALEHVGYSIRDQIFDQSGQLVATYYYSIPVQDHTTQSYYKQRDVNGTMSPTINFTPVVTGYSHVVAVAVCTSNVEAGQTALMSPYTTCTQDFRETLFAPEKDIFASTSEIYNQSTTSALSALLKANAYGTSGNAYIVDSAETFANLNLRLTKYSYLSSYTVEIAGHSVGKTFVEEDESTFVFKQTQNIEGITNTIGLRAAGSLGSIKYTGFDNTYDGQGYSISYSLNPTESNDKVALFRVLEANGVIKNLEVNAVIAYNGAGEIAALVAENNGKVENVTISSLEITGFTINASTLSSISFGGVVCLNSGEIVNAVNNAGAVNMVVRVNSTINVGGIVALNDVSGTIYQCGNNMAITISAYQEIRVGGIVGYSNGSVEECYNNAQISAICTNSSSITYVGGIVGYNDTNAQISKAYSKASINAESDATSVYAGGIVGYTKNSNIAYTYSAVSQIVIQRNADGEAIKYGGTFVGYVDTLTTSSSPNYYVYTPAFGREIDASVIVAQQIDISSYTALSDLVSYMNDQLQENVFAYQGSDIQFVWENS